ncbi:HepT-like ribonuclease domain-containing protein [Fusobacterium polymorphum]|uniref:Antitoxin n=1 Tax=Fusobacterium nucleatum subsp. polymorphum TaxID=76857 RepID=A0A246EIA3_FUSNP|nr:HepT-like ribonuclease domain-containing protein [Fusobacterium polymorphum]OWP25541.1 antitoxin [Fusobacterium polymorphum]
MSKLKRNIIQFTYDIEEFILEIKEEISGKEYTNFSSDKKLIGYIERQIEKIGEAINQIQKLDKDILLQINNNKSYWENIKGMRNRLIHEYWGTSIEMLYEISVYELDELLSYILKIRDEMESLNQKILK